MQQYWKTFSSSPGWGTRGIASMGVEAYVLGVLGGLCLGLVFSVPAYRPFLVFVCLLSVFHITEWIFAAVYHTYACTTESFLIPHSNAYSAAMVAAVLEYWIEAVVFGTLHEVTPFFWLGLSLCVAGQGLRWVAFVHAGHSFTHMIEEQKSEKHVLVTDGIYRYIRHPGYAGWFYWCVGTQLLLSNPVCTIGFAVASWRFFNARIDFEEELLASKDFFGAKYTEYKRVTPTYIPLIQ